MTKAQTCIDRAKARGETIAQSANSMGVKSENIEEVDGMFRFYQFSDGSRLAVKFAEYADGPRLPEAQQQHWISSRP